MAGNASDPPKRPRPSRPTRERIVRAGVHLFQSRGYHGTGLAAILARARAPKGSLYHHFPGGKEQLAVAALAWLQHEVTGFLEQLAAVDAGAVAMVEGLARYSAEGIRRGGETRGSLAAVLAQEAAPESAAIAAAVRSYADGIRSRLAAAWRQDDPGDDPVRFADRALVMLQGAAVLARIERRPERAHELVSLWLRSSPPARPVAARRPRTTRARARPVRGSPRAKPPAAR